MWWDDRIVLVDDDRIIDEVIYWEKPKFYDKKTSFGTPMQEVVDARPQRFSLSVNKYCHFWDTAGTGLQVLRDRGSRRKVQRMCQ